MRVASCVGSELATSGSVIPMHERISPRAAAGATSPAARACRTARAPPCCRCPARSSSSPPTRCVLQPMISASAPYSRLVSPAPKRLSGRKRFQSPRRRASAFSSSMTGEMRCGIVSAEKPRQYSSSAGRMRSSMKRQTFSLSSRTLGVSAKSIVSLLRWNPTGPVQPGRCRRWPAPSRPSSRSPRRRSSPSGIAR